MFENIVTNIEQCWPLIVSVPKNSSLFCLFEYWPSIFCVSNSNESREWLHNTNRKMTIQKDHKGSTNYIKTIKFGICNRSRKCNKIVALPSCEHSTDLNSPVVQNRRLNCGGFSLYVWMLVTWSDFAWLHCFQMHNVFRAKWIFRPSILLYVHSSYVCRTYYFICNVESALNVRLCTSEMTNMTIDENARCLCDSFFRILIGGEREVYREKELKNIHSD